MHTSPNHPVDIPQPAFEFGRTIHMRRVELGLTLQQLSASAGCAKSYLSMIENGSRGAGGAAVGEGLLARLEQALTLAPGTLSRAAQWSATPAAVRREMTGMESAQHAAAAQLRALLHEGSLDESFKRGRLRALVSRLEGATAQNVELGEEGSGAAPSPTLSALPAQARSSRLLPVQVPLINSVAAGYPREFTDLGYPARVADEYVLSPDVDDPDAFAARVVGDSMEPDYRQGDIVVFSPNRVVKSGMDCFVRLERDGETTFKRVMLEESGAAIRLVALNRFYGERAVGREDVAFMCPAVSVTRRIG